MHSPIFYAFIQTDAIISSLRMVELLKTECKSNPLPELGYYASVAYRIKQILPTSHNKLPAFPFLSSHHNKFLIPFLKTHLHYYIKYLSLRFILFTSIATSFTLNHPQHFTLLSLQLYQLYCTSFYNNTPQSLCNFFMRNFLETYCGTREYISERGRQDVRSILATYSSVKSVCLQPRTQRLFSINIPVHFFRIWYRISNLIRYNSYNTLILLFSNAISNTILSIVLSHTFSKSHPIKSCKIYIHKHIQNPRFQIHLIEFIKSTYWI